MKITMNIYAIAILCVTSTYYGVDGRISTSREQVNENQQKIPMMASMTSFESKNVYCVDILKQPAFNHPLLKNHKIQMEPSFSSRKTPDEARRMLNFSRASLLEDIVCPNGWVPIRKSKELIQPLTFDVPGTHFATFNTQPSDKIYHGAHADMSLYNPSVESDDHLSGALIWLQSGQSHDANSISVGWMVYPQLYSDNVTRLTAFWTGEVHGTRYGCFNSLCPGFVQVHRSLSLGGDFDHMSTRGGKQYYIRVAVNQDKSSGNWWLIIGENDDKIGYWPKELFSHLATGTKSVSFGGVTHSPPKQPSPPMGSGYFPSWIIPRTCHFLDVELVNEKYEEVDFQPSKMDKFVDSKNCYGVEYYWAIPSYIISFGGPGGNNCGL